VIPAGTDVVRLTIPRQASKPPPDAAEATVTTVDGRAVWSGRATNTGLAPGVAAQLDVPASRLPADDYIVAVGEYRCFLRVRGS